MAASCSEGDRKSLYNIKYTLSHEARVSIPKVCILKLCGNRKRQLLAAGLSDHSCSLFDLHTLVQVQRLTEHRDTVIDLKFSPQNASLLYTGYADGVIKLWDLRQDVAKCVIEYQESGGDRLNMKPILTFDVALNDNFLCSGTEIVEGDCFVIFWDIRTARLLGAYWDSHTDDITQVRFHPEKENILATGSTDGLMNVFDTNRVNEDDALLFTLNTESSVDKISWISHNKSRNALSCITHTHVLQLWDIEAASPYVQFSREKISEEMLCKDSHDCYLVDAHHKDSSGNLLLLCGSTKGQGEWLRLLESEKETLKPMSLLEGNKQIVQTSWYDQDSNCLVTGGESGVMHLWRSNVDSNASMSNAQLKMSSNCNKHKYKPW